MSLKGDFGFVLKYANRGTVFPNQWSGLKHLRDWVAQKATASGEMSSGKVIREENGGKMRF